MPRQTAALSPAHLCRSESKNPYFNFKMVVVPRAKRWKDLDTTPADFPALSLFPCLAVRSRICRKCPGVPMYEQLQCPHDGSDRDRAVRDLWHIHVQLLSQCFRGKRRLAVKLLYHRRDPRSTFNPERSDIYECNPDNKKFAYSQNPSHMGASAIGELPRQTAAVASPAGSHHPTVDLRTRRLWPRQRCYKAPGY
jgi:hypothetical protein